VAADREIKLTVSDNGHGLNGQVPPSLKRRARLLGADIGIEPTTAKGTRVVLRLKSRWFGILK